MNKIIQHENFCTLPLFVNVLNTRYQTVDKISQLCDARFVQ